MSTTYDLEVEKVADDALNAASGDYYTALQYIFGKAHKSPKSVRYWADVVLKLNDMRD